MNDTQQIAKRRVSIKRKLRVAGCEFDNEADTQTLESIARLCGVEV